MTDIIYYPEYFNGDLVGIGTNDGRFIPADLTNSDYQAYLKWVEENNG